MTNLGQTEDKSETNRGQTEDKPKTNLGQTKDKLETQHGSQHLLYFGDMVETMRLLYIFLLMDMSLLLLAKLCYAIKFMPSASIRTASIVLLSMAFVISVWILVKMTAYLNAKDREDYLDSLKELE